MPDITQISRMRQRQRIRHQRNPLKRFAFLLSLLVSLIATGILLITVQLYSGITRNLPSLDTLPYLLEPPNAALLQPTTLYDRTGEHILLKLDSAPSEARVFLTTDTSQPNFLPATLISATIAMHDPGFWQHAGYLLEGWVENSHPTIAQKIVSDLLLWQEPPGLQRALRERLLAAQATSNFGREKILAWFLNYSNFGHSAIGADAAAFLYFRKPASKLSLAEAAVLSAVAQSPALNPLDTPDLAQERGQQVIQLMLKSGIVNAQQAQNAMQSQLNFVSELPESQDTAPAFTNLVLQQLSSIIEPALLARGGFRITTTLDFDLQRQADCTAAVHLARFKAANNPDPVFNYDCAAARLLATIPQAGVQSAPDLALNLVILDPTSGHILALIGEPTPGLDPTNMPGHPPGTLLTPLIYLTGFTRGFSPASLLWDIPSNLPSNLSTEVDFHGPQRLRMALANDYLAAANQVLAQVGVENVWRISRQMGLTSAILPQGETIESFLTEGQVNLLEISQVYAVYANQGILTGVSTSINPGSQASPRLLSPSSVIDVQDHSGSSWLDSNFSQSQPVITSQLAYLMNNILSDEPARWPTLGHPNPLEIGRPVAAKIGVTGQRTDSWTIGYTPYLVVGSWIGSNNPQSPPSLSPDHSAVFWNAIMKFASQDYPAQGWEAPTGVNTLAVCDPSGMLPSTECPATVNEIFQAGSEPTQLDTLYRSVQINRETNRLATVFTPPEMVESKTFLAFPPEAADWARQAGLATPPDAYDVIPDGISYSTQTNISSPAMFAYVQGVVPIEGSAMGEDFVSYRLQAGKGLNPKEWLQIGSDRTTRVDKDVLGLWDTRGLSGLYALELLVVHQDSRIESAVVQVTVDNQPPEVRIDYPSTNQEFPENTERILFRVDAHDNLALNSVEFWLDGKQVALLAVEPYIYYWRSTPGEHNLSIIAEDQAGNSNEASLQFSIRP